MKNKLLLVLLFFILILPISFVIAQSSNCDNIITSTNVNGFLNEISSINNNLNNCNIPVAGSVGFLIGDGNVLVSISMKDGSVENFYITIDNKEIQGISSGKPTKANYEISIDEETMNKILSSSDIPNSILSAYGDGKIKVKANGIFNKIKWFFGKFFVPSSTGSGGSGGAGGGGGGAGSGTGIATGPVGKPDYCDDTYLPGHRNYAQFKTLWDTYSSDTDKVCQSQFGRPQPSPCIHVVQLSIDGTPYILCWYNE